MATNFNATALANGTSNLIVRATALMPSTDLVQAGVVFNDAVRISEGLFNNPNSGNANPFLLSYTTDIHAVQNDIAAILATPANATIGGQAFTLNNTDIAVLTNVQAQLGQLLTAAPMTANATTITAASQTLHAVETQILGEIAGDAHLAAAINNVTFMANTGAIDVAFQTLPSGADDPASLAAAAAGGSLQAVGAVFNAAAALAVGGINAANLAQVNADFTAVQSGLNAILNNADMLAQIENGMTANAAALTTIHLQTVANQVNIQLNTYDALAAAGNNTGLRGTADNIADLIDVFQNDPALNIAGGGTGMPGHIGAFAELPGGLAGTTTKFQDNQAQTNFWAAFLAEANTINAQLVAISNGTAQATAGLVTQIQNYQQFGANFDAAQGAVFRGRFDDELLNGTLEADTAAAVKGLMGILNGDTGAALAADKAMINAAGQGFVADAQDVAGNNITVGGATYVGSATTVATATSVNGLAMGTIAVGANPNIANGTGGTATTGTTMGGGAPAGGGTTAGGTPPAGTPPTTTPTGNGTGNMHTSHHHHHSGAAAAAAAPAATHTTAASHTTAAAHSMPTIDHHAMHHMWA